MVNYSALHSMGAAVRCVYSLHMILYLPHETCSTWVIILRRDSNIFNVTTSPAEVEWNVKSWNRRENFQLLIVVTRKVRRGLNGRGGRLITHLHLAPRLNMWSCFRYLLHRPFMACVFSLLHFSNRLQKTNLLCICLYIYFCTLVRGFRENCLCHKNH